MDDVRTLEISPSKDNLGRVVEFVESALREAGVPPKVVARVNVAVDEVFANIVGYSGASDAGVSLKVDGSRLTLVFSDDGKPFDPTCQPEPDITLTAEERSVGGLGIFMVKKIMDAVEYERSGGRNLLRLEKAW